MMKHMCMLLRNIDGKMEYFLPPTVVFFILLLFCYYHISDFMFFFRFCYFFKANISIIVMFFSTYSFPFNHCCHCNIIQNNLWQVSSFFWLASKICSAVWNNFQHIQWGWKEEIVWKMRFFWFLISYCWWLYNYGNWKCKIFFLANSLAILRANAIFVSSSLFLATQMVCFKNR